VVVAGLAGSLVAAAGLVHGQPTDVQLGFAEASLTLLSGEKAMVAVEVVNVPPPGIAAFQMTMTYGSSIDLFDPNEAFSGTVPAFAPLGGDPLCTTVRDVPVCPDPVWLLTSTGRIPVGTHSIDNVFGEVQIAYGTMGIQPPPTGTGAIALIEVEAISAGGVRVNLSDVILADNQEPPTTFPVNVGFLAVSVDGVCLDVDGDGFGFPGVAACPNGATPDCDDDNMDTAPGAPEVNDGLDNQCPGEPGAGLVDETGPESGFYNPADRDEYSWTDQAGATLYEVARSAAADFSVSCTIFTTAAPLLSDPELPAAPGDVFYYLNRALAPYAGSWGADSMLVERVVPCS
jgi:hypothetical protein